MLLSEKVKSNIYEIVDRKHLCFDTKRTDLYDVVSKIWDNRFTAAIFENGRHGNQDANSQWPNIQISSKYMKLCVYQIWCLYHKMNNMLAMPPHYNVIGGKQKCHIKPKRHDMVEWNLFYYLNIVCIFHKFIFLLLLVTFSILCLTLAKCQFAK